MNIHATEMTVATGTVTYGGDPDDEERIRSREVRVSVTYWVEGLETSLADLAHAKAAEVEGARIAAQERIDTQARIEAAGRTGRGRADAGGPGFDPGNPGLVPPDASPEDDDDDEDECDDDENDYDGDPPAPHGAAIPDARHVQASNGRWPGKRYHPQNGPCAAAPPPGGAGHVPPLETDWATRPQVLALGSHFRRLGIGPADQTALLRARFGKFRPERLTKDEAAGLMRSLERGETELEQDEAEIEPSDPGNGNIDGHRYVPAPA